MSMAIESRIFLIRGCRVMLDSHLAELYGVKAIRLREQVRRNRARFPPDFMFRMRPEEATAMVSQNAIPSRKHMGGHLPFVFTQEGVAMLSSVLRSPRAVEANIFIMRAFVKLRDTLALHKELASKFRDLERRIIGHDAQITSILDAIRKLMNPPAPPPRRIGFHP
ncbi:MAG: ORF6N domain-containing protein [Elusimicrobia bacterium]|nr:ORF6N domain-containing protein [Elusimicrobiota bacterium]